MASLPNPLENRKPDHPIDDIFLKRWSPRAMTGEPVSNDILMSLLEAARWAPSTYNEQEWRFVYAHRDTDHWKTLFDLLVEANQDWCKNAGVLILVASKKTMTKNGKPNPVHSLDAGMAVQNLMLQSTSFDDIATHAMAGFDRGKAKASLKMSDDFDPECMIAIGKIGDGDKLPKEILDNESITGRKPVSDIAKEGVFDF